MISTLIKMIIAITISDDPSIPLNMDSTDTLFAIVSASKIKQISQLLF